MSAAGRSECGGGEPSTLLMFVMGDVTSEKSTGGKSSDWGSMWDGEQLMPRSKLPTGAEGLNRS